MSQIFWRFSDLLAQTSALYGSQRNVSGFTRIDQIFISLQKARPRGWPQWKLQRGSFNAHTTYGKDIYRFASHRAAGRSTKGAEGSSWTWDIRTPFPALPQWPPSSLRFPICKMKLPSSVLPSHSASNRRQNPPPPAPVLLAAQSCTPARARLG